MFMQRTRLAPAFGKEVEVREAIADIVRGWQAKGRRVELSQRIISSEGTLLVVTSLADDIGELETMRRENLADQTFQKHVAHVSPLLRDTAKTLLAESLLMAPSTLTGPPPTVTQLLSFYPTPGKESDLIRILEERVRSAHADGIRAGLWRRIYSSDGPAMLMVARFADLSDLDRHREARRSGVQAVAATIGELSRAPVQMRLTEAVVPMPS